MAGRPPINDPNDVEAIEKKIEAYFSGCNKDNPCGFAGFAHALGYSSRTQPYELSKKDVPISEPIKRALLYIEADYEKALRGNSCTGAIFALKNRGWSDRAESDEALKHLMDMAGQVIDSIWNKNAAV